MEWTCSRLLLNEVDKEVVRPFSSLSASMIGVTAGSLISIAVPRDLFAEGSSKEDHNDVCVLCSFSHSFA